MMRKIFSGDKPCKYENCADEYLPIGTSVETSVGNRLWEDTSHYTRQRDKWILAADNHRVKMTFCETVFQP
jgi:hypothetical protein